MGPDKHPSSSGESIAQKIYSQRRQTHHLKEMLNDTSAFHGVFQLPPDPKTIEFTFLNPALRKLFDLNGDIATPDYLEKKLRTTTITNNWDENPTVSLVTSLNPPELEKNKFFGLTIEKIGNNLFHLTGRDITDKEVIRQQRDYEMTHDPATGYLNAIGWKQFSEKINREKRADLKPKNVTVFYFDLAGVQDINNEWGHNAGDKYIVESFQQIAGCFRKDDVLIRINTTGDELVIYLPDIDPQEADILTQRLNALRKKDPNRLNFYFGVTSGTPEPSGNFNFSDIINQADLQQKADKNSIKANL